MNHQKIIDEVYKSIISGENSGKVASYIPALQNIDPNKFGVCLTNLNCEQFDAGDCNDRFSVQSIAKVFALTLTYNLIGEKLWDRMDVEPSGMAYNSSIQLELENGIPRNPLINAGAIVMCDILCSNLSNPKKDLLDFVRKISNCASINFDNEIAESEAATGHRNFALAHLMKSFGNIHNEVANVLDLYFHLCSIKMNCTELSRAFLFLSNKGNLLPSGEEIIISHKAKRITAIMGTCGFYDEAGEFAFRVGLPGKSGVGGGIVALLPGKYAIAVWSPKLNKSGNSFRGFKFLEEFTSLTENNIF